MAALSWRSSSSARRLREGKSSHEIGSHKGFISKICSNVWLRTLHIGCGTLEIGWTKEDKGAGYRNTGWYCVSYETPKIDSKKVKTSKILNNLIDLVEGCQICFSWQKNFFWVAEKDIWHGAEDMYVYKNTPIWPKIYRNRDRHLEAKTETDIWYRHTDNGHTDSGRLIRKRTNTNL